MNHPNAHPDGKADQFALIAAPPPAVGTDGWWNPNRSCLVEPQPPVLPPTLLPVEPADGREFFTPVPAHDSPKAVRADLDALKKTFAPFMRRMAPALPAERTKIPMDTVYWRSGTD